MSIILDLDEIFERTKFNPKSHFSRGFKKYSISDISPGLGKGVTRSLSNAHGLGFKQGMRHASLQMQQDTNNEPEQTPDDSGDSNEQD